MRLADTREISDVECLAPQPKLPSFPERRCVRNAAPRTGVTCRVSFGACSCATDNDVPVETDVTSRVRDPNLSVAQQSRVETVEAVFIIAFGG